MKLLAIITTIVGIICSPAIAEESNKEALAKSKQTWEKVKAQHKGNYSYQVVDVNMIGGRTVTTITVTNNKVTKLTFEKAIGDQVQTGTEEGEDIGKNAGWAKPLTLDEIYSIAEQVLSKKLDEHQKLYIKFDDKGILTHCFTIDTRIMDDAPKHGVSVANLEMK